MREHSIKKRKMERCGPRPECIPWPENEPAVHVTHDLLRERPVSLYMIDLHLPAQSHSMTCNLSVLSCKDRDG